MHPPRLSVRSQLAGLALVALATLAGPASAQFHQVPSIGGAFQQPSLAGTDREYRGDGARHIYAAYGKHIYKGKLPPLLYGIAVVETEIDASGQVRNVRMVRPPSAPEVGPWVVAMIRKASPFPAPQRMGGARYTEVWLVSRNGTFQLDTLTEGQH